MACFMFRVRYVWVIGLIGACERGFVMFKADKLSTFHSSFKNGNIELWRYSCPHRCVYELRYLVQFDTPDGVKGAASLRSYNLNELYSVLINDAIELANTPLLERD